MNVEITWDGSDITNHVISYRREQVLCDSVGTFSFTTYWASHNFDPWDTVILYENGIKKGTYFISGITKDAPKADVTVNCQDGSKRLTDYYIDTSYFIENPSRTRYWIEKFLVEAGVTYTFNVSGNGNLLSNNTNLGMDYAINVITTLLKQSGWYIYFNAEGTAIIGEADVSRTASFDDSDIIEITMNNNDSYLRNRAVVWGGAGYYPGSQVGVAVETQTPWEIDDKDKRSVLYTHSGVKNSAVAYDLANKILNEFDTIVSEKTVKLAGVHDVSLCDLVDISNRDVYSGDGIITSIASEMSSAGLTTTLVLDEKCPRMFGFYSYGDQYVYAGSANSGIHRKPIPSPVWEDYSEGLTNRRIVDLKINKGLLVCVTGDGYGWKRLTSENVWTKLSHGSLLAGGITHSESLTKVVACAIDQDTNDIYFGVSARLDTIGWIIHTSPDLSIIDSYQIKVNGDGELVLYDIDTDNRAIYATLRKERFLTFSGDEYSCNFSFTTNGEREIARSWSGPISDSCTAPVFCNGKVYYVLNDYSDPKQCQVVIDDYTSDPTESTTRTLSTKYTHSAYLYEKVVDRTAFIYYDRDSDTLYFSINIISAGVTDDLEIIAYDVQDDTFAYLGVIEDVRTDCVKNGRYGMEMYRKYKSTVLTPYRRGYCTFGVYIYDIVSLSSDDIEIGSMPIYDEDSLPADLVTETYYYGDHWSGIDGGMISMAVNITDVPTGSPPGDNSNEGEGSYEIEWMISSSLVYAYFDCVGGSLAKSGVHTIYPAPAFNICDYRATVHDDFLNSFMFGGKGSYYGEGPYIYLSFNVRDYGPWIPNPDYPGLLEPPYILLGARDCSYSSSNTYPRFVKLDISSGSIELIGVDNITGHYPIKKYFTGGYPFWGDGLVETDYVTFYDPEAKATIFSSDNAEYLLPMSDYYDNVFFLGKEYNDDYRLHMYHPATGALLAENILVTYSSLYTDVADQNWQGENVISTYLRRVSGPALWDRLIFNQYSSWDEIAYPAYLTTKEFKTSEGTTGFKVIDETSRPHQLEISFPGRISTFAYSGLVPDCIRVGYSGGNFVSMPPRYISDPPSGSVNDIRISRTLAENIVPESGFINLIAGYNQYLEFKPVIVSGSTGWTTIESIPSGIISKVETSNYRYPNYVFYSTYSGVSISGVNTFYQRLTGLEFMDMSINIPATKITVIRLDDRI